jgi:ubiquinol-cytochrome c reductase iron-sulfur subunit
MTTPGNGPGNTGGQQPSPPTNQTSAEAAGSIRDRLASPLPNERASSGGDERHSDVSESDFQQTHHEAADDQQRVVAAPAQQVAYPEHRSTQLSESEAKRAERKVAGLFLLSLLGVLGFIVWYFVGEFEFAAENSFLYTPLLGVFMATALGGVGAGAVLWAKTLMVDEEAVQEQHPFASPPDERAATAAALKEGFTQSGLGRRPLLVSTLLLGAGSLALLPVPLLFGLGKFQHKERVLGRTAWREGMRLVRDDGSYVRLGDLLIGGVESVFPDVEGGTHSPDSPALLIRMRPEELELEDPWDEGAPAGHVVYSSICTHLGCPVKLYEQQTHNMLCPCHQSTFDAAHGAKVIFGPAARPLPQLPIGVDEEGYFVALSDFLEPVGPSFWERG